MAACALSKLLSSCYTLTCCLPEFQFLGTLHVISTIQNHSCTLQMISDDIKHPTILARFTSSHAFVVLPHPQGKSGRRKGLAVPAAAEDAAAGGTEADEGAAGPSRSHSVTFQAGSNAANETRSTPHMVCYTVSFQANSFKTMASWPGAKPRSRSPACGVSCKVSPGLSCRQQLKCCPPTAASPYRRRKP